MAVAQNTISILETIKKKMQKFDDKTPAVPASAAPAPAAPVVPVAPAAPTPIVPAPAVPMPAAVAPQDDLDLDDLDLDDENAFLQAATTQAAPAAVASTPVTPKPFEAAKPAEVKAEANFDDLSDLGLEDDDLLDDHHDLNLEHHEPKAEEKINIDAGHDDLNFDDLEDPIADAPEANTMPKQEEKKTLSIDDLDNLSLEDLESDLALSSVAKPAAKEAPKASKAEVIQDKAETKDDLFDEEFEKEFMDFNPQAKPAPVEQFKPAVAAPVAVKPPIAPKVQYNATQPLPLVNNQVSYMDNVSKPSMLSQDTVRQASDSVKKLLDAKNMMAGIKGFSQSPVLGEMALQLLEPKLEKWLNENLAHIVENIVREEIKNIMPK